MEAPALSDAREEILTRIRRALVRDPVVPDVPRLYATAASAGGADGAALLAERAAAYRAGVIRCAAEGLGATLAAACARRGVVRAAVAAGLDAPEGIEVVRDDPPLDPSQLETLDGVISGCALAIAETGTIVLDGSPRCGRRALTLVPDYHLCVVLESQIVLTVPDAITTLERAGLRDRPLTLISGPSATSDIELDRVEGVHGPRTLDMVVVGGS